MVLVVVMEAWSLATPLGAYPDSGTQTIKAVAVARGQWIGTRPTEATSAAVTAVRVPDIYLQPNVSCFAFHPTHPAGCTPPLTESSRTVSTVTHVGRYPPLYYLLVGWPSLVFFTTKSMYAMRTMSVLVNAAMLALAFATAQRWSRSPLLLAGLAVAVTPMTLFMSSVVDPSGLEITSAIAMWTAATVLVIDHPGDPPTALIRVLAVATAVLVLVRGDSPLWPVLALGVLFPFAWRRIRIRELWARRDVRLWGGLVVAAGIGAVAWVIWARALAVLALAVPAPNTPAATIARVVAGQDRGLISQSIGVFGWLDTPVPLLTELIWIGAGGGLVVLAVLLGSRRGLASVALAVGASGAVPFIVSDVTARHSGLIAQGRYFLPLVVCIPIVAAGACNRVDLLGEATRRVSAVIIWLAALGQFAAAAWALRRYLVGIDGPLLPTATVPDSWRPPLGGTALDLVFVVGFAAMACLLVAFSRWRGSDSRHDDLEPPTTLCQDALRY
jgi:hypothetical protein